MDFGLQALLPPHQLCTFEPLHRQRGQSPIEQKEKRAYRKPGPHRVQQIEGAENPGFRCFREHIHQQAWKDRHDDDAEAERLLGLTNGGCPQGDEDARAGGESRSEDANGQPGQEIERIGKDRAFIEMGDIHRDQPGEDGERGDGDAI